MTTLNSLAAAPLASPVTNSLPPRPLDLDPGEQDLWNKAQHASPGPWQPDDSGWFVVSDAATLAGTCGYSMGTPAVANAHYIAAASPDRVRALLSEVASLRAQLRAITELSALAEAEMR